MYTVLSEDKEFSRGVAQKNSPYRISHFHFGITIKIYVLSMNQLLSLYVHNTVTLARQLK